MFCTITGIFIIYIPNFTFLYVSVNMNYYDHMVLLSLLCNCHYMNRNEVIKLYCCLKTVMQNTLLNSKFHPAESNYIINITTM